MSEMQRGPEVRQYPELPLMSSSVVPVLRQGRRMSLFSGDVGGIFRGEEIPCLIFKWFPCESVRDIKNS